MTKVTDDPRTWMGPVEQALAASGLHIRRVFIPAQRYTICVLTDLGQSVEVPVVDALVNDPDFPDNIVRLVRAKLAALPKTEQEAIEQAQARQAHREAGA